MTESPLRPELSGLKAVLLDRDGVLNVDRPDCVHDWSEWRWIPGSAEAVGELASLGLRLALVTNQSCVGRGWVTPETLAETHRRMAVRLRECGAELESVHVCPHAPDAGCDCRKPAPGLFHAALAALGLQPEQCLAIGDSTRDHVAAAACGVPTLLVLTGKGARSREALREADITPIATCDSLAAAVAWMRGTEA